MIDTRKNKVTSNNMQSTLVSETNSDTCDTPLISAVQSGDGEEFRIVKVGTWTMQAPTSDDEPRVRDVDLAERLEFKQIRDIRKLIKRLEKEGELTSLSMRAMMARIEKTGAFCGVFEERTIEEYWLTESQALIVAMHSKTEAAKRVRQEIVRVYMLARRGLLPQHAANDRLAVSVDRLSMVVAKLGDQMTVMQEQIVDLQRWREELTLSIPKAIENAIASLKDGHNGTIGEPKAERAIKCVLRRIAKLHEPECADVSTLRKRRTMLEHELRNAVDHPFGRAWRFLPIDRMAKIEQKLYDMERIATAIDATRRSERARLAQQGLFEFAVANITQDDEVKKKAN